MTEILLWKSSSSPKPCPKAMTRTGDGEGCLRTDTPALTVTKAKAPTPEETTHRIEELMRRLIVGGKLLFEADAGSALDAANQILASLKGADIARQLSDLGYEVSPKALASAIVATQ